MMHRLDLRGWTFLLAVATVASAACGGGGGGGGGADGSTDGGTDATTDAADGGADGGPDGGGSCGAIDGFPEPGDADGHPDPLGLSAGEVRAGRLDAGELPEDPKGLQLYEAGDFVLVNDRVAVIVEDVGESDLYNPWGGAIVGIARFEGGRLVRPADYTEILIGTSRFVLQAESVTVVADGSSGVATVRAIGALREIPFLKQFPGADTIAPGMFDGMRAAVDYTLRGDSPQLEVSVHYLNASPDDLAIKPFYLIFQKERMPPFVVDGGRGFDVPGALLRTQRMGFVSPEGTSYAWAVPEGEMNLFLTVSGTMVLQGVPFTVPGCSAYEQDYGRLVVGGPDADGLTTAYAEVDGVDQRTISGVVRDADGRPVAGAHVHVTAAAGMDADYLTRATTGSDGRYTVHVPADASVFLRAYKRGYPGDGPYEVPVGSDTQDFAFDGYGTITVTVVDEGSGTPLPARIQVLPADGPPTESPKWGEPPMIGARLHIAFPVDGQATFVVPAGVHRVVSSRGLEYDIEETEVTVASGDTVTVTHELVREVQTPGWMSADFHIHTIRSPDAPDAAELKVRSAAGDGLEIPLRSEHDWVAAFEPVVSSQGLEDWLFGIDSLELTTFAWGHMGVFPISPDPTRRNNGAIEWFDRLPPDVFADVRSRPGSPAIVINHPRSFGGAIGSYFEAAELDPDTGSVARPEMWDEDFRLVEVFNDSSFDFNRENSVRDWFALLRSGRKVFAVGSSDSHKLFDASPVGYPRTYLDVGVDTAPALRARGAQHVKDVALSGAMTISGGVFVEAVAASGGVGPGGTVMGASDSEDVQVTVQAPCWIDVRELEVIVDGSVVDTIDLSAANGTSCTAATRFDEAVSVPIAASGSWVIFHALGDTPLDPVFPDTSPPGADPLRRTPFGVTNPIFFER